MFSDDQKQALELIKIILNEASGLTLRGIRINGAETCGLATSSEVARFLNEKLGEERIHTFAFIIIVI